MDSVLTIEGEALEIATELARMNNRSIDAILTEVLRERLDRERLKAARDAKVDRILAIGADIRAHLLQPTTSADTDELYDEDGFPR